MRSAYCGQPLSHGSYRGLNMTQGALTGNNMGPTVRYRIEKGSGSSCGISWDQVWTSRALQGGWCPFVPGWFGYIFTGPAVKLLDGNLQLSEDGGHNLLAFSVPVVHNGKLISVSTRITTTKIPIFPCHNSASGLWPSHWLSKVNDWMASGWGGTPHFSQLNMS